MDKYIGKKLDGRYEIIELIGVGGMANVYKAYDAIEDRTVAVKILRDEFLSNEEFLRRFKNESKAIAVLSHPNIVKVFDVSFSDSIHSIVMEYIDGITLKEYIEQQHVLNWKEAVHFTVQILRAIQHAHDRGIVHRDIKPQNIMLLQDGTIKVTDFGIARFARSETKTITDKAIGSVHYISPEQAYGKPVDGRSDIYSIGVMLFEMLTGTLPFEADTAVSVALKQIQAVPMEPHTINPDIPRGLEQITMRAMQKEINKRYQSAAEMLRDIDEFKRNPNISFEYQPISDIGHTKEIGAVSVRGKTVSETEEESAPEKEKSPALSIIAGVATGFIISAVLFVVAMVVIMDPFATTATIQAPDLVGKTLEEAQQLYPNITIEVEKEEYMAEYDPNKIYYQSPPKGRNIKEYSTILVRISLGAQMVEIPYCTGDDGAIAMAELRKLGFKVVEEQVYNKNIAAGLVVKTIPGHGEEAIYGSTVTVQISMGSDEEPVVVPDLQGMTIDEARDALRANGLELGGITTVESSRPSGQVVSQNPLRESRVDPGTLVDINISGDSGDMKNISISVKLPTNIMELVNVQGVLNGVEQESENLIPAEVVTWNPIFSGRGMGRAQIIIDSVLYQEYLLDFDTGYHMLDIDNSDLFQ